MSITLVASPRTANHMPSPALAALKPCVEKAGFTCSTIDLNIELFNDLRDEFNAYSEIDSYFQTDLRYLSQNNFDLSPIQGEKNKISLYSQNLYNLHLQNWATRILQNKHDWIGVSLLSVNSVLYTLDLCTELKTQDPDCKIVLGGPGVSTFGIMGASNFGVFMQKAGLADTYIAGEGEYALIELLQGATDIEFKQIDDIDVFPFPDYSDFNFKKYTNKNNAVAITGSRGCVRNCTFCDIKSAWKQYRFRSGKNIAEEIINHYQKYGSTEFYFTDSLINGSLKSFGGFLDAMIDARNSGRISEQVRWSGQFICRPIHQFKEEWYKRMQLAGAKQLHIGIESGSEAVMHDMGKILSNDDIDYTIKMLTKYKIQCDMLMIVGYPTETKQDFNCTLDLLERLSVYNEKGTISGVNLGKTMVVLPGSPIGQNMSHWGIEYDENNNWISTLNPKLDFKERVRRRLIAQEKCEELGYMVRWPLTTLSTLSQNLKLNKETV